MGITVRIEGKRTRTENDDPPSMAYGSFNTLVDMLEREADDLGDVDMREPLLLLDSVDNHGRRRIPFEDCAPLARRISQLIDNWDDDDFYRVNARRLGIMLLSVPEGGALIIT